MLYIRYWHIYKQAPKSQTFLYTYIFSTDTKKKHFWDIVSHTITFLTHKNSNFHRLSNFRITTITLQYNSGAKLFIHYFSQKKSKKKFYVLLQCKKIFMNRFSFKKKSCFVFCYTCNIMKLSCICWISGHF